MAMGKKGKTPQNQQKNLKHNLREKIQNMEPVVDCLQCLTPIILKDARNGYIHPECEANANTYRNVFPTPHSSMVPVDPVTGWGPEPVKESPFWEMMER